MEMPIPEDAPQHIKEIIEHINHHNQTSEMKNEELDMRIKNFFDTVDLEHLHTLRDLFANIAGHDDPHDAMHAVAYFAGVIDTTGRLRHEHEGDHNCTYCRAHSTL